MTLGEDGCANDGIVAAGTGRCVKGEESNWFLLLVDIKFLCYGLFGRASR